MFLKPEKENVPFFNGLLGALFDKQPISANMASGSAGRSISQEREHSSMTSSKSLLLGVLCLGAFTLAPTFGQAPGKSPYTIAIGEDKTAVGDQFLPIDPTIRIAYEYTGGMTFGVHAENKRLTCGPGSAITLFKIDGQMVVPNNNATQGLPPGPNNKKRTGMQTSWMHGQIKVTMELEVIPGRPALKEAGVSQKRRMDTLLVKYIVENTGNLAHQFGARMLIDTMVVNNDGALFASPTTHPGKILDGVMLADKNVPEFVEILERENLANPGFKGVFTFKFGNKLEGPSKIVMANFGSSGPWDVPPVPAMGDSCMAIFWDTLELKANSKREFAFAYGQGLACNLENEGKVSFALAGNFEPEKLFTVTAYVNDPIEGQNLTLELPKGIERVEGKETQSVPPVQPDLDNSVVLWRCSVLEPGSYDIRIRSSNGVIQTRSVTVTKAE
jgi:hypothetical protein